MDDLNNYFVEWGDNREYFQCWAEDADHAAEQCNDAYPDEQIHAVWSATSVPFNMGA